MKQLSVLGLIWELFKILARMGNVNVYYHAIGGVKDSPMEVEGVEIRDSAVEPRVTIW
jgi:hypothetical protein